jgi:aryl-alcohol dehydrogenase-like predicted oxidoreductase
MRALPRQHGVSHDVARQPDRAKALQALKDSFELNQQVLTVVSKDTAPNHWAMLCAELGHTLVAALPLLSEQDRKKMAKDARPFSRFYWKREVRFANSYQTGHERTR